MIRKVLPMVCAIALCSCDGGDGSSDSESTTGETTSSTDDVATTIPVTSVTETTNPTSVTSTSGDTEGSSSDGSSGADGSSSSSGGETGSDTSSSTSTGEETTTTTGEPVVWDVEWCNLQFPAAITGAPPTTETAYSRIYVEGLTGQTPGNDLDDQLIVGFGYGADGSDPAEDDWTWVTAEANGGWNGGAAGQPDNDEYQAALTFDAAGTFDYAARVSGDGGVTWVHCDLDGLVEGGYSPDQAGSAEIAE